MDILDVIKNPAIIGIVAGVITYIYLTWRNNVDNKKRPADKQKEVNLLIPLVVLIIVWFVAYAYFQNENTLGQANGGDLATLVQPSEPRVMIGGNMHNVMPINKIPTAVLEQSKPFGNLEHIQNQIHIPDTLPDVMLDMYDI